MPDYGLSSGNADTGFGAFRQVREKKGGDVAGHPLRLFDVSARFYLALPITPLINQSMLSIS